MKVEDSSEPWYQALQNDILILNYEKFFFLFSKHNVFHCTLSLPLVSLSRSLTFFCHFDFSLNISNKSLALALACMKNCVEFSFKRI